MNERAAWSLIVRGTLFVLLVAALAWWAWTVRHVFVLLTVSLILAIGLLPLLDAITGVNPPRQRFRLPRPAALGIVYLGLFLLLILFVMVLIPPLITQLEELVDELPGYAENMRAWLADLAVVFPMLSDLEERLNSLSQTPEQLLGQAFGQASTLLRFAMRLVDVIISFLFVLVITFYMTVDGKTLRSGALRLVPVEHHGLATDVMERVKERLGGWLLGQAALSAIIGTASFVGLSLLGVPYAMLLAVIAAVGEVIPMVGPWAAAVPAVLVALTVSPLTAVLTAVLYLMIQQLENNLIVPMVMRKAVDLPPVLVMAALLMGAEMLGVIGAILALPVAASIAVVVNELLALRDRQQHVEE